jgi:hypothetical protein
VTGPVPDQGEHYVAVPIEVLEYLKALWLEDETDRLSIGTVRLLLRSVRYDTISGQLVLGIRMARDLDDDPRPPEPGQ